MTNTKQLKITKLFGRGAAKAPEDCKELQEEIQQLEQMLKEKQEELFNLQRNSYRYKSSLPKKKNEPFIRPQKMSVMTSVESLKRNLELMSMLTGIEVQSYILDDHCCITYSMQHDAEHQIKHGLRIELTSGANEISKSSLPLGFNLEAVLEHYDNIMNPECLGAIKRGLLAYYDRQGQYEALKILDASHIEVTFVGQNERDEDGEHVNIVLILDYRVYDIRPKHYHFKEVDLPEGAAEALAVQCTIFKRKPLHKAFKEAFLDGIGPYKLVEKLCERRAPAPRRRRARTGRRYQHNDDTFRTEDCPEPTEESEED